MGRRITSLTVQKRNPNRVNVYLEGEFAFGLARVVAAWLYVGQELSEERITQLQEEDSSEVAYQKALNFLSYRIRSEAEVRTHLVKADIEPELIDQAVERLNRSGLLNDQQFAENWVENRSEFRPRSRRALTYELKQKGIPEETINAAVEELDEQHMAYLAAQKKAKKYYSLDWPEFKQKMYAFLARRGFSYEVSAPIVTRIWQELSEEHEHETNSLREEVDL
jgi:regulatory protein